MRWATLVVVLAFSGCGGGTDLSGPMSTNPPDPSTSPPASTSTTTSTTSSTTPPTSSSAPEETTPVAPACDEEVLDAVTATIDGQHRAIIEGDFERALTYSSRSFRAGSDPERFAAIIRSGYSFLLEPLDREVRDCARSDDLVALVVSFRRPTGSTIGLAYRLTSEEGSWRIEAAGIIEESRIDV